jgi:hypothetical protein
MKKSLLFILSVFSFGLHAQTLTQAGNEPVVGNQERLYGIDTSAYSSGLPNHVNGNTAVWNFTSLLAMAPADTTYYVDPSTVSGSSNYSGCTVVQKSGILNTFIKSTTSPTTQTEILGVNTGTLSLKFTNSAIAAIYPLSFGSGIADAISGSYTALGYNGPCSGIITTTVDGLGTLNLPNSVSFSNVLRVKSVQTITLTQIVPFAKAVQTIYNYYHSSQKFPILSVNYTALSLLISSGTPTVTGFVTGNVSAFVTSIKETNPNNYFLNLYPNPARDYIHLSFSNIGNDELVLDIYDLSGRKVMSHDASKSPGTEQIVSLRSLASGLYTVIAKTNGRQISQKLIID